VTPDRARPLAGLAVLAAAAAVGPLLAPWILFLLTVAMAKALAVMGVVLLLRGGLITFGQALYYAVGAYTAAFAVRTLGLTDAVGLLGLAALAGAGVGGLLGLLLVRYRGVYFALLNLAFSMVLYAILLKSYQVTGGTDGLRLPTPSLAGWRPSVDALRLTLYYLTLGVTALLLALAARFAVSPLGYTLRAVKDNEVRVEYMGASVRQAIYWAYGVSAVLGSVSGALVGFSVGHVVPDFAFWTQSGELVFVAILGGTGSLVAPVAGSIVFEFVRNYAIKVSPYTWQLTLGVVLLGIIFFLPGGLWSLAEPARRWQRRLVPSSRPSA
jgi:branched-chain amino acid transport system permease protein